MKKISIGFIGLACITAGIGLAGCGASNDQSAETTTAETTTVTETTTTTQAEVTSDVVTQADIEKKLIGKWMKADIDGKPALTNEKSVFDIVSTTEAFESASHKTDDGTPFDYNLKSVVDINGNVVTITATNSEGESLVHEFIITNISDRQFTANQKFTRTVEGADPVIKEYIATFDKVSDDYSEDIIGTWEGHCTSEGTVFDDGQEHRWEYKDDGSYVYYTKNGDNWVRSEDTINEYFAAGNLLCLRWIENGVENREWWEINIDGDKMNWTALCEGDDGKTFTATFDMKKAE